ncbi:GNAT family N-acetyltransferase [Maribacter sp. MJ134]|uniref:GNAT family N-acetyltransferase n=1 Tax=Maribacter sp. MJ134 TaxID=2496865 RepID=UPI000F8474F4|nr:GNAT family N-acetyltransferase [Maribacter sp. MJ134]AZQ59693.1 GNAT family N-acetyltransferase [Maribacter sp. MJ134]
MDVEIKKLPWDSLFFGYSIGKVFLDDFDEHLLAKVKVDSERFKLSYVFSNEKIDYKGFKHVDTKIIFKKENFQIPFEVSKSLSITSFDKDVHDSVELKNLALQSGKHSRFYVDEGFKNDEYDKLYSEWLSKSLKKKLAFQTLVALEEKKIIGFVTIAKVNDETAEIGLLAVDAMTRGKGVGSQLINKATQLILELGYNSFLVATQEINIPAVKLYKKAGFKELSLQYIYHIWNDDTL